MLVIFVEEVVAWESEAYGDLVLESLVIVLIFRIGFHTTNNTIMRKTKVYLDSVQIFRPKAEVFRFLADLRNLKRLHPYINQIVQLDSQGVSGKQYRVVDRFPLFLYYATHLSYTATVSEVADSEVVIKASPGMGIDLVIRYIVKEGDTGNECRVMERSQITGNRLLLPLAFKGLKDSHRQVLDNLKWLMEWKQ